MPYMYVHVQVAFFNLSHPYLRSTTIRVLLENKVKFVVINCVVHIGPMEVCLKPFCKTPPISTVNLTQGTVAMCKQRIRHRRLYTRLCTNLHSDLLKE